MDRQEAIAAAARFLAARYPAAPPAIVLREEWTREHAWAWRMSTAVSTQYLETGVWPYGPASTAAATPPAPALPPEARAQSWLDRLYGPTAELAAPQPVAENEHAWWFALRLVAQPGYPATAMLNASLVVPKDAGCDPFHPANADPWGDAATLAHSPRQRPRPDWERRVNARGCVLAVDCGLSGIAATALPWQPAHEAHGWWDRLVHHLAGTEVGTYTDWNDVFATVAAGGPGTRGVVWIRRELHGHEATGHLLHAHFDGTRVVVLDGQTGGLARLDPTGVHSLTLARYRRAPGTAPATSSEWHHL